MAAEDFDRAGEARRTGPEQILGAPQPERGVTDDQHQRKGGEQLEQLGRAVDSAQQHDFDHRADEADRKRGQHDAAPETDRTADMGRQRIRDVEPQHIEGPVREIDDAGDAENQRQSGGEQEQTGGGRQPVKRLEEECVESHGLITSPRLWERSTAERKRGSRVRGLRGKFRHRGPLTRLALRLRLSARHPLPASGERENERKRGRSHQFALAGRIFLTTASGGITEAPSTYLKSVMVPLPFSTAILPT